MVPPSPPVGITAFKRNIRPIISAAIKSANKSQSKSLSLTIAMNLSKLINKYLKQFELSDMLNKKVYQLSGGEQQRIAIIKLILQGSQIILADEPTSGLDKENELIVMKLLKELNEKGITIIMVTHNMNLCDCFSRVINVENFR